MPGGDLRTPAVAGDVERQWLPGGDLHTPAVVVDVERLDRNIARMATHAASEGIALRPHAKTHKSPAIAGRQLAAGAAGLTVATVGEAEVFAAGGATDLFVAYPLWADADAGRRLTALASAGVHLSVGADSAAGVAQLRRTVEPATGVSVMVEVDSGMGRSGAPPAGAGAVALAAVQAGFGVAGVFTFPGHSYRPGAAASVVSQENAALATAAAAVEADAGVACARRSGGSTPTAALSTGGVVNELRPGVYVFHDAQQVALGTATPDDVALWVVATVVSTPSADRLVLDSGSKVLGPERPDYLAGHGMLPELAGAVVTSVSEHHAVVTLGGGNEMVGWAGVGGGVGAGRRPRVGDRVAVVPNHVCYTVNLVDELVAVAGGEVAGRWPVAARGRNR